MYTCMCTQTYVCTHAPYRLKRDLDVHIATRRAAAVPACARGGGGDDGGRGGGQGMDAVLREEEALSRKLEQLRAEAQESLNALCAEANRPAANLHEGPTCEYDSQMCELKAALHLKADKVELAAAGSMGHGVLSTGPIEAGCRVFEVPEPSVLSLYTALASPTFGEISRFLLTRVDVDGVPHSLAEPDVVLMVYLLHERSLGPSSRFALYFASLPPIDESLRFLTADERVFAFIPEPLNDLVVTTKSKLFAVLQWLICTLPNQVSHSVSNSLT
eukprot:GHVU01213065.1.p1 GENE.GHVU01213065.1~~GHVU01213065.1.p1  ORF type:complete len:274 (+),score=38.62 GHVU01213065.1:1225-2046(+)